MVAKVVECVARQQFYRTVIIKSKITTCSKSCRLNPSFSARFSFFVFCGNREGVADIVSLRPPSSQANLSGIKD